MRAPYAAVVLGAVVATTLVEPLGARAGEPIAQVSLGPGVTRTVEAGPGASLVVTYVDGERTERQTVDLAVVAPGSVPVEVRALVLGGDTLALAVVARHPDEPWATYHWARDRAGDSKARSEWVVSTPIFRSSGRPFRIVELRARDAGIEATFRRGEIDPGEPDAPIAIEEKVYANADPADPEVRYDRPGEVLVEGTLRRDPPATVVMTIAADGALRFTTPAGTTVVASLGGDDPLAVGDALARLVASGGGAFLRRNTLEVRVDGAARWRWVQWGVQALAHAWSVRTLRFPREGGAPIELALPQDAPPSARRGEEPPGIDVGLARAGDGPEARTVVHFPGGDLRLPSTGDEPDESRRHAATEPLRTRLAELQRTRGPAVVVVSTPPPRGAEVPAGDVLIVVRAVQETNPVAVHLGGASPPGGAAGRAKTPVPR